MDGIKIAVRNEKGKKEARAIVHSIYFAIFLHVRYQYSHLSLEASPLEKSILISCTSCGIIGLLCSAFNCCLLDIDPFLYCAEQCEDVWGFIFLIPFHFVLNTTNASQRLTFVTQFGEGLLV